MRKTVIYSFFMIFLFFSLQAQSSISSSISSIRAQLKGTENGRATITLSWEIPEKNDITSFLIYRANFQITKENISTLKPIATLSGRYSIYDDTGLDPLQTYYYCILTETINKGIFDIIIPTVNTTVSGLCPESQKVDVSIYVNEEGKIQTRENERELTPLPCLNELPNSTNTIDVPEKYLSYSKHFAKATPSTKTKPIQILPSDVTPDKGEQYLLSSIVNGSFKEAKWDVALNEFNDFLSVNRSEELIDRAHFYIGQVYYYKGESQKAIFAFIKSQNSYPIESRLWIDEVLVKINQ